MSDEERRAATTGDRTWATGYAAGRAAERRAAPSPALTREALQVLEELLESLSREEAKVRAGAQDQLQVTYANGVAYACIAISNRIRALANQERRTGDPWPTTLARELPLRAERSLPYRVSKIPPPSSTREET